jgi:putative DNA primase/helicase
MSADDLAAMALTYATVGWRVFPVHWIAQGQCSCRAGVECASPGKHPLTRHGLHEASLEVDVIAQWWGRWPEANIGLPAHDNGLAVLDVDPRHGGHSSLKALEIGLAMRWGAQLPSTLTQITGSGGRHLVFAAPEGGIKGGSTVFGPAMTGLDTRGRGGYIVAAPSMHASGGRYRWVDFFAATEPWPALLTKLMEGE